MRGSVILAIAAIQISAAQAADDGLCFTEESKVRAHRVLTEYLHPHRVAREEEGAVVLACEVQPSERVICSVTEGTDTVFWREAALAYTAELQACPASPRHFSMPIRFAFEDD